MRFYTVYSDEEEMEGKPQRRDIIKGIERAIAPFYGRQNPDEAFRSLADVSSSASPRTRRIVQRKDNPGLSISKRVFS